MIPIEWNYEDKIVCNVYIIKCVYYALYTLVYTLIIILYKYPLSITTSPLQWTFSKIDQGNQFRFQSASKEREAVKITSASAIAADKKVCDTTIPADLDFLLRSRRRRKLLKLERTRKKAKVQVQIKVQIKVKIRLDASSHPASTTCFKASFKCQEDLEDFKTEQSIRLSLHQTSESTTDSASSSLFHHVIELNDPEQIAPVRTFQELITFLRDEWGSTEADWTGRPGREAAARRSSREAADLLLPQMKTKFKRSFQCQRLYKCKQPQWCFKAKTWL